MEERRNGVEEERRGGGEEERRRGGEEAKRRQEEEERRRRGEDEKRRGREERTHHPGVLLKSVVSEIGDDRPLNNLCGGSGLINLKVCLERSTCLGWDYVSKFSTRRVRSISKNDRY